MNAEQKRAWFTLSLLAATCVGFVSLGLLFGFRVAWAACGVMGLGGLTPLIGRWEKPDERDVSIARLATLAGGMASYLAFIAGCMGVWCVQFAWYGRNEVSVHTLGLITGLGGMAFFTARSLAILLLYGRHVEAGNV